METGSKEHKDINSKLGTIIGASISIALATLIILTFLHDDVYRADIEFDFNFEKIKINSNTNFLNKNLENTFFNEKFCKNILKGKNSDNVKFEQFTLKYIKIPNKKFLCKFSTKKVISLVNVVQIAKKFKQTIVDDLDISLSKKLTEINSCDLEDRLLEFRKKHKEFFQYELLNKLRYLTSIPETVSQPPAALVNSSAIDLVSFSELFIKASLSKPLFNKIIADKLAYMEKINFISSIKNSLDETIQIHKTSLQIIGKKSFFIGNLVFYLSFGLFSGILFFIALNHNNFKEKNFMEV